MYKGTFKFLKLSLNISRLNCSIIQLYIYIDYICVSIYREFYNIYIKKKNKKSSFMHKVIN